VLLVATGVLQAQARRAARRSLVDEEEDDLAKTRD
jgi:hypothetical protein